MVATPSVEPEIHLPLMEQSITLGRAVDVFVLGSYVDMQEKSGLLLPAFFG